MRIACITGARGFLGRWLARELSARGVEVVGLGHGGWPEHELACVKRWVNGEVDSAGLEAAAAESGLPDMIFHVAGGSSVGASFQLPREDFRRTVVSTAALLEWVRVHAPQVPVVFVSSAAVYGSTAADPISEDTIAAPVSPYGTHKSMAETLCISYARNFAARVAIVRLFSVYGPGLRKQLVWDLCTRFQTAPDGITLGGTGDERRDWIHVRDAVRLLTIAGEHASSSCPILNGGTGAGTTVRVIAETVAAEFGARPVKFSNECRAGDPHALVADVRRARRLGFTPVELLVPGLRETVRWAQSQPVATS